MRRNWKIERKERRGFKYKLQKQHGRGLQGPKSLMRQKKWLTSEFNVGREVDKYGSLVWPVERLEI